MEIIESQPFKAQRPAGSATALHELIAAFRNGTRRARARGLFGAARGFALAQLAQASRRPLICVEPSEEAAEALERDLRFFLPRIAPSPEEMARPVVRIPADEALPYEGLTPDRLIAQERLSALYRLHLSEARPVVLFSVPSLARRVLPRAALDRRSLQLSLEMEQDRDQLALALSAAGYAKVPLVEDPGTFAVRGGVFDLWSPLEPQPARLEFFGDVIEKIRAFDPQTQRTIDAAAFGLRPGAGGAVALPRELTQVSVCPAREIVLDEEGRKAAIATVRAAADAVETPSRQLRDLIDDLGTHSQDDTLFAAGLSALLPGFYPGGLSPVTEYLPRDAIWVLDDPLELERHWGDLWTQLQQGFGEARRKGELALPPEQHFLHEREVRPLLETSPVLELSGLTLGGAEAAAGTAEIDFDLQPTADLRGEIATHHGEDGALAPLVKRLELLRERGAAAIIACHSSAQAERTRRMLLDRNLMAQIVPLEEAVFAPHIHAHLVVGEISAGFIDLHSRLGVISDEDIFGPRAQARRAPRRPRTFGEEGADFRDLKEGDLVVHVEHGIARYDGLTRLNVRGFAADFILLQFAGKDKLYLPVGRLRQIQKYAGGDASKSKLDSLQSKTFAKRKARVKEELLKMAAELLDIYAARAAHQGFAFTAPDVLYRTFEADFEFDETPDQEKAIEDVLEDMQDHKPMDRLVCGDVGYGKTEVALRAAFKAVEDKKQVAVLVPTTVLAAQHFRTFQKRFADYPVTVEMVSRLRDEKTIRESLHRAREGKVDVLVGTHRLLSPDVAFKDLGLVVVDEEQRFGVKHKERLKKLRKLVDVLTLTATPIPRTLHMAMMGVRDLSIIGTPPLDRRAIRTFVSKFDREVIKDAIERELARGGQVFFLHNRIETIGGVYDYLAKLVPQAKIAIAHGQMAEGKLEKVMTGFVDRQFDVLLCTSIIESGLDIPSANTILVDRADMFGLSQLYQIRGRVGRSRERAYAYLLIPARRSITRDAQKRLQVLQQFTELGAGFQIASHDLEIRGAGNLLGPDQSGNIAAVGFDLYTQLMEEAVASLKGEEVKQEFEPDVELPIPALIPEDYLPEVQQRLFFYKRLASAATEEELYDVKGELRDQCGEPPAEVDALVEVMSLKNKLRALRMRGLKSGPSRLPQGAPKGGASGASITLVVQLGPDAALDPIQLAQLVAKGKGRYRLTPGMELVAATDEGAPVLESARSLLAELRRCAAEEPSGK